MLKLSDNDLKKFYKAPFHYDGIAYIWDANGAMVADFMEDGFIRPRGWGRFQQMPNGANVHDSMEAFILRITNHCGNDPKQCIEVLNQEWGNEK